MSQAMIFIRHDGKARKCYAAEEFVKTGDKFDVRMSTNGYWSGLVPVSIGFDDVISMNTEATDWLESNGVQVPDSVNVRATGYGADVKQKLWDERKRTP